MASACRAASSAPLDGKYVYMVPTAQSRRRARPLIVRASRPSVSATARAAARNSERRAS